jgi:serine/threonine protein kinase
MHAPRGRAYPSRVSSAADTRFPPGTRIGGYTLEAALGAGAMGVVFRARRSSDGEIVAIKLLRSELGADEVARRRFLHEARSAREITHAHLVPLIEVGEHEGTMFLAMPFYRGGTLAGRIADGPLSIPDAIRYLAEVAAALDALHARQVIHRDLKPSNVLLDDAGRAHISDFGLAKGAAYTALTQPGQKLGTFEYMAPELISGSQATTASDIYALGCLAYECLAGAPPFAGRPLFQLALAHLEEEPPSLDGTRADIPAALAWALTRALAKDPAERPPTATAYANVVSLAARGTSPG